MKWVDGHKPLFSIELKAVSSIHAQVGELGKKTSCQETTGSIGKLILSNDCSLEDVPDIISKYLN